MTERQYSTHSEFSVGYDNSTTPPIHVIGGDAISPPRTTPA
ncbi:hypothetical protein ACWDWO_18815 [Actinopolymorpha singaporensis]|nr:hypothetical protein [Actinopolymorpha singaporensis]